MTCWITSSLLRRLFLGMKGTSSLSLETSASSSGITTRPVAASRSTDFVGALRGSNHPFTPEQLGLDSDLEVQIPKSIHRLRLPGAGSRFVHGGAALQEIVVPVLTVNKKRKSDTRLVNVEVLPESDKITTGQLIGLRFASDAELPELARRALTQNLDRNTIKKAIVEWRADDLRV